VHEYNLLDSAALGFRPAQAFPGQPKVSQIRVLGRQPKGSFEKHRLYWLHTVLGTRSLRSLTR
jgi:hypothetical protein